MEKVDLIIIGAGIYGLTMAATYHRIHPEANLVIIDSAPSIGGTWSSHRIFPGLKTNNQLGTLEHPDFPMDERFGVKPGEHIPAETMLAYLNAFVEWSDIRAFLRLNTFVEQVEKNNQEWIVHCANDERHFRAKKLVLALGHSNKPHLPNIPNSSIFKPPVIHSKELAENYPKVVRPGTHTLIVGGGKSAWDAAYACATQPDSTTTVLVRPSGNGPIWMTPSHVTPATLWLEKLVFTRFFSFLSPCPWAEMSGLEGWLRSFFHSTWLGRKITAGFWHILGEDSVSLSGLDKHPETKKMRPWRGAFEVGCALSIHNYPSSIYDLVREGKIKIVFDEIAALEGSSLVRLKSQDTMNVDAIIYATGWEVGSSLNFKPASLASELGMPSRASLDAEESALITATEHHLHATYPFLRDRDTSRTTHYDLSLRYAQGEDTTQQPYRLHRFMVPLSSLNDRTVAFSGALYCLGTIPCAYLQSLWIMAYFDDILPAPFSPPATLREEMYRYTQYCALRGAMSHGRVFPDLVFDSLSYFDQLLGDMGFSGKRKGGRWAFREAMSSYGPEDYKGLLDDVQRKLYGGEFKKDV
ncbi:FAD-containing monooxygenase EthA 5 [Stagonosporopsis vannaccii]|nr:FAD-containing monooxygenase EthA 5 [Stagonosporopsis vannaccii]